MKFYYWPHHHHIIHFFPCPSPPPLPSPASMQDPRQPSAPPTICHETRCWATVQRGRVRDRSLLCGKKTCLWFWYFAEKKQPVQSRQHAPASPYEMATRLVTWVSSRDYRNISRIYPMQISGSFGCRVWPKSWRSNAASLVTNCSAPSKPFAPFPFRHQPQ